MLPTQKRGLGVKPLLQVSTGLLISALHLTILPAQEGSLTRASPFPGSSRSLWVTEEEG